MSDTVETRQDLPKTFGELKASGYEPVDVKEEMRGNLIKLLREKRNPFTGILGYEQTVIPQIENAILAKHDILLLGLRGQAKTRMARQLVNLLDEYIPAVAGCPLRSSPFEPLTKHARHQLQVHEDEAELEWIHRSQRYQEKLATPDVSIADLIGDVDPIKAVARKLDLSDEEVIHFGIIPRANRGIFAINELPDLQGRIQVGLLNIMEEKDIQIRGFPIRMPLDLAIIYTANPEDYTNRGNIITPLKDRIDAQIMTHYPEELEIGIKITEQEAWTSRGGDVDVRISPLLREMVEQTAVEARRSEYIDKTSGVSARMSISFYETLYSVAERRAIVLGESQGEARIHDMFNGIPAISGKVELIYKGEQEGIGNVALHLIGRAARNMFNKRVIPDWHPDRESRHEYHDFQPIVEWFDEGNAVELDDSMSRAEYKSALQAVNKLEAITKQQFGPDDEDLALMMEFVLEGLHQNFMLTKKIEGNRAIFTDALSQMMGD